jgi:protein O-GlcNAc transferase
MHFVVDQLLATAQAHAQGGRPREAAAVCEQVLQTQPNNPRALFLLGYLFHQAGQWQPALARLSQAVAANPAVAEPHFLIGLIHQQQRNLPAAIAAYQQVVRLQPKHPKALNNLGRALVDAGQITEGIAVLRGAVNADPRNASAQSNLGDALRITGDFEGAAVAQRRAIAADPKFAEAHSNLGTALAKLGKISEAMASMRRAMEINPKLATPHYNLARLLQDQGKLDDAIRSCRSAIALRPNYSDSIGLLGNLSGVTGDVAQAIANQRLAMELNPQNAGIHSNLLLSLHYVDNLTPDQIFQAHLEWAARHGAAMPPDQGLRHTSDIGAIGKRRLRIGYVSPNFSNHSVAYFIEPVLAAHDRSAFEIFCYADQLSVDEVTGRLRLVADHWRDITGKSDAIVAGIIRQDDIDILVDLAGHTSGNRMELFASKPAPVQVSWIGYPDTTGLAAMDYRLTDAIADPPGDSDRLATEKLIRIEGGCWAYQPPADSPAVAPTPVIENGHVTFGSFNNLPKVTPAVLKTWAGILHAVPNSRLLMKAGGLSSQAGQDNMLRQLTAAGIDPARIELLGWAPATSSHLQLYSRIDIALDTFPYNGTTTTCEALWMGVPVISFPGATHASRVGASLLTNAGLPELLADDLDGYVAKSIALAGDLAGLMNWRADLRRRFSTSPVCDGSRLCRAIESIFTRIAV